MAEPLMPKATAVWLVENTALTFEQIADFTGMHELEISGIADGEVAQGIKGMDPVLNGQLDRRELERCQKDKNARLKLKRAALPPEPKRKGPRYTPLSKRQDRPAAIAWLIRHHPELTDAQISKLVGTTKPTIQTIRDKSHWNMSNITPTDPVALGLCKQVELDEAVGKSASRRVEPPVEEVQGRQAGGLMSVAESLATFSMGSNDNREDSGKPASMDPDALFNLPDAAPEDEDEDNDDERRG